MRRLLSFLGSAAVASTLLAACNQQAQAPAPSVSQPGEVQAATAAAGSLPIAHLSDEQLQARWNQLATAMSMEKMQLHDCKPAAAPGKALFFATARPAAWCTLFAKAAESAKCSSLRCWAFSAFLYPKRPNSWRASCMKARTVTMSRWWTNSCKKLRAPNAFACPHPRCNRKCVISPTGAATV